MAKMTPSGTFMCTGPCQRYGLAREDFYVDRSKKYELSRWCKRCESGRTQKAKHEHYLRSAQAKQIRERRTKRKYYLANRQEILEKNAQYRKDNREMINGVKRAFNWKWKYHLSKEERQAMIDEQQGCCEICGACCGDNLCVDHDHATNRVRAMLCRNCNLGLGYFKDKPEVLRIAIAYLHFYQDNTPL